jgi:hypothetical protein
LQAAVRFRNYFPTATAVELAEEVQEQAAPGHLIQPDLAPVAISDVPSQEPDKFDLSESPARVGELRKRGLASMQPMTTRLTILDSLAIWQALRDLSRL